MGLLGLGVFAAQGLEFAHRGFASGGAGFFLISLPFSPIFSHFGLAGGMGADLAGWRVVWG